MLRPESIEERSDHEHKSPRDVRGDKVNRDTYQPTSTPGTKVTYGEVGYADTLQMSDQGHGIIAVVPAHNEGDSIYATLKSLYDGTMWPDLTFVVANNCSEGDETLNETLQFKADHPNFPLAIHDVQGLVGRKVGALCYSWEQIEHLPFEYFISMDADVVVDKHCVADIYEDITSNDKAGGVSARYSFLPSDAKGPVDRFLLFWQRMDFTMWTAGLLKEKDQETYVLGGQISILDAEAMRAIASQGDRLYPWSSATAVEDMELTWRLNDLGYTTHCSTVARAWVGHMPTRAALWGQRMKWDRGIVDLLRDPSMKGKDSHYLKEPKRQQWRSLTDLVLRVLLYTALPLALLRGSYELFERWWMPLLAFVPILLSMIVGAISASVAPKRRFLEIFLTLIYFPMEAYVWFRTAIWARAWIGALRGEEEDLWAAQARSEGRSDGGTTGSARSGDNATRGPGKHRANPTEARLIKKANREQRDELRESRNRRRTTRAVKGGSHKKKPRFRSTVLTWATALFVIFMLLGVFWVPNWFLPAVMALFTMVFISITLFLSWLQGRAMKKGKKPYVLRWFFLTLIIIGVLLAATEAGRSLVMWVIDWLKWLVYINGIPWIDGYLFFAWYTLMAMTIIMSGILVAKILQIIKIRMKGLRP